MQEARRRGELPVVACARAWAAASASIPGPRRGRPGEARPRARRRDRRGRRVEARRGLRARRTPAHPAGLPRACGQGRARPRDEGQGPRRPRIARAGRPGPAGRRSSAGSLARAIQRAMDRRIEGLLAAAVRSRRAVCGADAVTGACKRGEAALVVVACDAAAAADLTEVRRAVAEGRAVAWGSKQRLGAIAPGAVRGRLEGRLGVSPGPFQETDPSGGPQTGEPPEGDSRNLEHHQEGGPQAPAGFQGVGVIAITSRPLAQALRRAVQTVDRVSGVEGRSARSALSRSSPPSRERPPGPPRGPRGRPRQRGHGGLR